MANQPAASRGGGHRLSKGRRSSGSAGTGEVLGSLQIKFRRIEVLGGTGREPVATLVDRAFQSLLLPHSRVSIVATGWGGN